ncbi:hypothetical protein GCM10007148_10480 [Parvularcula lutaonensis]|nr:hypothetical protein GCM10007148_10480 [Parvularcula lutaonensis]
MRERTVHPPIWRQVLVAIVIATNVANVPFFVLFGPFAIVAWVFSWPGAFLIGAPLLLLILRKRDLLYVDGLIIGCLAALPAFPIAMFASEVPEPITWQRFISLPVAALSAVSGSLGGIVAVYYRRLGLKRRRGER